MSKSSEKLIRTNSASFWSFLEKVVKSFRFRLFLFIVLIYIAGATLDVTNTNPGSRFMLTKSIARYGDFTIREEDRIRYSYLDFSILNRFRNPSFEEGLLEDASNWAEYGQNSVRELASNHTGNYGFQINTKNGWVEQDIKDLETRSIYLYKMRFWAKKSDYSEVFLNITIFYEDSTISSHWVRIRFQFFNEYEVNLGNSSSDKVIDKIRFQNANSSAVILDDVHLGSIYSDKPPGLSLMAVPIYWFGEIIAVNFFGVNPSEHFMIDDIVKFLIIISVLILGAFTTVKFYDLLRLLGISQKSVNFTTLIFALGSVYYVYIGTFFSHSITASLLLLATYFSTKFRLKKEASSLLWSAILSGYAVVCDYTLVFLLPFLFFYSFIPFPNLKDLLRNWKQYMLPMIVLYFLPIIICGFLVIFYNFVCFNDPLKSPYAFSWYFWDRQHFAESMFKGLEVLLFSRHHGLISFMPIVLICLIGFIPMFKKAPGLATLCIALSSIIILLYSKYYLPTGGLNYGPRQIVSIIPFLIIPLGYFWDLRDEGGVLLKIKDSIKVTTITVLKGIAIILSALSFLINFAGGWVGVYPLGGEGMLDPIWGTIDQVGHIETLLSWFSLSLSANGAISLESFFRYENNILLSCFKLDTIFLTLLVEFRWPTASSLAMGEPTAFLAALLLALLINPFFNVLGIGDKISNKFPSFLSINGKKSFITILTLLELALVGVFIIWSIFEAIRLLKYFNLSEIHDFLNTLAMNLISILNNVYANVSTIPIVNLLTWGIIFCIYIIVYLLFLRDSFTFGNWFVNIGFFILITSIAWIGFRQLEAEVEKGQLNEKILKLFDKKYFKQYQYASQILVNMFLITSLWSLLRDVILYFLGLGDSLNPSLHTNLTYILLISVFISTMSIAKVPFDVREYEKKVNKSESIKVEKVVTQEHDHSRFYEARFFSTISLIGVFFLVIHVLEVIFTTNFSLKDLFFINPTLHARSITDWFVEIDNPVPVYLCIGTALFIIMAIIPIYEDLIETGKVPKLLAKLPDEVQDDMKEKFVKLSAIQSIFILGSGLLIFIFLLIMILYSVLSTVPNPMLLELHLEEWLIWYSIFFTFILGMVWAINFYNDTYDFLSFILGFTFFLVISFIIIVIYSLFFILLSLFL